MKTDDELNEDQDQEKQGTEEPGSDESGERETASSESSQGSDSKETDDREQEKGAEGTDAPPTLTLEEIAREATSVTEEILTFFPKVPTPKVSWKLEDESIWVEIEGDPTGRLIGRRGKTIEAFQHILSKIISHRLRRRITIQLDAEGYRRRHRDKLIKLARQTADYVAATESARALEPMSPADRRIVHMTLKEREDVTTASEGRNPDRFVVIWPSSED